MNVDIEELKKAQEYLRLNNNEKFQDLVWVKDGKVFKIDEDISQDFRFTGLSNTDFIRCNSELFGYE